MLNAIVDLLCVLIVLLFLNLMATTALLWCVCLKYKVLGKPGEPQAKIPWR